MGKQPSHAKAMHMSNEPRSDDWVSGARREVRGARCEEHDREQGSTGGPAWPCTV